MTDARQIYLETQVWTATPQKLRLMLIEGGLRQAQMALEHASQGRHAESEAAFTRCREIVSALTEAIRDDGSPLMRGVLAIYTYLSQSLIEMQIQSDISGLAGVVQVLQEERQTWQELCQLMPEAPVASTSYLDGPEEVLAPKRVDSNSFSTGYFPSSVSSPPLATGISSGFSLEI